MSRHVPGLVLCLAGVVVLVPLRAQDADGDGLPDFDEIHKYLTDPQNADSDGDGVPDGDWAERREYQYTVRSVVQVLRPVTPEYLCDDYQDARVVRETPAFVELEVVHYPFATAADAIAGDAAWRRTAAKMKPWTEPGPTNDWTPKMRRQLLTALQQAGIDAKDLDDRGLVERASQWLCAHAVSEAGFTAFSTGFDRKGRPFVPDYLQASIAKGERESGRSVEEQWQREVSARGMFECSVRGTCTSSAIYLNGCLRALGVPTRTVLCIPVVDANDADERAMLQQLQNHEVRRVVTAAIGDLVGSWASHTFNEVFVGGRWVRLNYGNLGQGIFDRQLYGLITHVATFSDWADARAWETIGRRQKTDLPPDDPFGGRNPYSTVELGDAFGAHCQLDNPTGPTAGLAAVTWSDDPSVPQDVRAWFAKHGRFGLVLRTDARSPRGDDMKQFLERVDRTVRLVAAGHDTVDVAIPTGLWWLGGGVLAALFDDATRQQLASNVVYRVELPNTAAEARWRMPGAVTLPARE